MPFEAMDERELRERVSEEFGAMRARLAAYERKFGAL